MSNPFAVLAGLVANMKGASFISIDTETPVKLPGGKSNILQGRVIKRCIGHNVMIFQNKTKNAYDAMVRRRLVAEGKDPDAFELSPRKWGTRLTDLPFVEHKGEHYFEVIFMKAGRVEYFLDGNHVDPALVHDPLARLSAAEREVLQILAEGLVELDKGEADQGGLNDKVVIRTFKCANIRAITIDHKRVVL